jgi:hypothetical protein
VFVAAGWVGEEKKCWETSGLVLMKEVFLFCGTPQESQRGKTEHSLSAFFYLLFSPFAVFHETLSQSGQGNGPYGELFLALSVAQRGRGRLLVLNIGRKFYGNEVME